MVDHDRRSAAISEIQARLLEVQKAHVAKLELLEEGHRLDLDVLTDIFGVAVLDGSEKYSQSVVKQLEAIYAAQQEPRSLLFVSGQSNVPRPGCRGFGGDPGYDLHLRGALFTDGHTIKVECRPKQEGLAPAIMLSGRGVILSDGYELPSINEDNGEYTGPLVRTSNISIPLAELDILPGMTRGLPKTSMDLVISTDDPLECYDAVAGRRGTFQWTVGNWLLQYASEYIRRVDGGILIN